MSDDKLRDALHNVQDALSTLKEEGDLTDNQVDDLYQRYMDFHEVAQEQASCDHENANVDVPPDMPERDGGSFLRPSMDEGKVATLHAKCDDCGAVIGGALEVTIDRPGKEPPEVTDVDHILLTTPEGDMGFGVLETWWTEGWQDLDDDEAVEAIFHIDGLPPGTTEDVDDLAERNHE
jgi:hypothetical protein